MHQCRLSVFIEEFKVGVTSTYIELPTETTATLDTILLSFGIDLIFSIINQASGCYTATLSGEKEYL